MNDKTPHGLDDLFETDIPQADASSKAQAIKMASAEFSEHFEKNFQKSSQGSSESARRIDNRSTTSTTKAGWLSVLTNSIRSFFMNTNNNPMAYKGFVAASVAFIAVSVIFITPQFEKTPSLTTVVTEPSREEIKSKVQAIEEVVVTSQEAPSESVAKSEPNTETKSENNATLADTAAKAVDQDEKFSSANTLEKEPNDQVTILSDDALVNSAPVIEPEIANSRVRVAKPRLLGEATPGAPLTRAQQNKQQFSQRADSGLAAGSTLNTELSISRPSPDLEGGLVGVESRPDADEEYAEYQTNPIKLVSDEPVSTFSIDVDTASYTLVRNQLNSGLLPLPQAVRVEEFINYFDYDYPLPKSKSEPFKPTINVVDSPWNKDRKLVHIGIKGYDIDTSEQPDSNLVFLLDVSGSMSSANKLPLVKQSVNLLLDTLKPTDTVSIVVYAGAAGTVLEPTKVSNRQKIIASLQRLDAGGSTAGGAGIELAYQLAEQNFNKDAVNRIILATDGDFNVGQSSNEDLKTLVERKRKSGVFLSILGFGRNNYQDDMMQALAQNGNGVAAYIDSLSEAKKVLVDEATSTLFPIAKDVKIQLEFNPATVSEYRLVGYETRALKREDFNNDKVDAGDIGAGHSVTAIYEITTSDAKNKAIDEPRYTLNKPQAPQTDIEEYGFVKIRYKLPDSDTSKLIQTPISTETSKENSDVQFSIAVAGFGQLLSGNTNTGDLSYAKIISQATKHKGSDPFGYRSEFIQLVRLAEVAKP